MDLEDVNRLMFVSDFNDVVLGDGFNHNEIERVSLIVDCQDLLAEVTIYRRSFLHRNINHP